MVLCLGDHKNRERIFKTDPILRKIDENSDRDRIDCLFGDGYMVIKGMMCSNCHRIFSLEDSRNLIVDDYVVFDPSREGICKLCEDKIDRESGKGVGLITREIKSKSPGNSQQID